MTEKDPKRPARRKPSTSRAPSTEPVVEAAESTPAKRAIPAWRQRLYKIPILGPVAYMIAPPRRKPSYLRRSFSAVLTIVALLGIGMAAYPWAGEHYPGFYRIPVERLIDWSNSRSRVMPTRSRRSTA